MSQTTQGGPERLKVFHLDGGDGHRHREAAAHCGGGWDRRLRGWL